MKKLLLFFLLSLALHQAKQDPTAWAILEEVHRTYQGITSFTASFTYTKEVPNEPSEIGEGKITIQGDYYRLVLATQELGYNGTTVWHYLKEEAELMLQDPDPESPAPITLYALYAQGYQPIRVTKSPQESAWIDLVPEEEEAMITTIQLQVDLTTKRLQAGVVWYSNGTRCTFVVQTVETHAALAPACFTFSLVDYPAVEVVDLR